VASIRSTMTWVSLGGTLLLALPGQAHPLDGQVWDTRSTRFVTTEAAYDQAAAHRYVLLGEAHDSALHHDLQRQALDALARRGRHPALAMEQFDRENQGALDAAQATGQRDAEALADAGKLNRQGWRWPFYRDLIAFAAEHNWSLRAANLSRAAARDIALGKTVPELPASLPGQIAAVEQDIVTGHCGQRPGDSLLAGLVAAQRTRDATMASVLVAAGDRGAVLIAGAGHVRRDRAVPAYLADDGSVLTLAYVETAADKPDPVDYDTAGYDLVWFTPPVARPDACAKPPGGLVAPGAGAKP